MGSGAAAECREGHEPAHGVDGSPNAHRVQVVVRVRPQLGAEAVETEPSVTVDGAASRVQVVVPGQTTGLDNGNGFVAKAAARAFEFDACLGPEASQMDVFEACKIRELMDSALEGYAVTVFAFGQTGAGKTHTMSGSEGAKRSGDGLVPCALRYAYDSMASQATERSFTVKASFSEIYNDTVRDLLANKSNVEQSLPIRNDRHKGFYVDGLTTHACDTADDAVGFHQRGLSQRQMRAHKLNEQSSRSHCLLTLHIESKAAVAAAGDGTSSDAYRRFGKITFVDLAGSERLKQTGNTAAGAVWETGNINKSLFALGKVISTLSGRRAGDMSHVPFRDSKLTQLLIDSLGGRGRSLMIACCSPSEMAVEETMNTLHFASLALRVKSKPVVILDPADQLVMELRSTIRDLRADNKRLSSQMERLISEGIVPASAGAVDEVSSPRKAGGKGARGGSIPGGALGRVGFGSTFKPGPTGGGSKKKKATGTKPRVLSVSPYPDINVRSSQSDYAYGGVVGSALSVKPKKISSSSGTGYKPKPPRGDKLSPTVFKSGWTVTESGDAYGAGNAPLSDDPYAASTDFSDFPELAALEAQFQSHMAMARTGVDPAAVPEPSPYSPGVELSARGEAEEAVAEPSAPDTPTQVESGNTPDEPAPPEEAAVDWANRNKWFGRDQEMTEYAYQIHDVLVEAEGIDPSSSQYYEELDARMRERFGDEKVDGHELEKGAGRTKKTKPSSKGGTFGTAGRFGGGNVKAGNTKAGGGVRTGVARQKPVSTRPPMFSGKSASIAERMSAQVNAEIAKKVSTFSYLNANPQRAWNQSLSPTSSSPTSSATRSPRSSVTSVRSSAVGSSVTSLRSSAVNQYGFSSGMRDSHKGSVDRGAYLERRREIIRELQIAKAEAEAEHKRLYQKIKFTLDAGPRAAFS